MNPDDKEKYFYLSSNLLKGLVWLGAIVTFFLVFKYYFEDSYKDIMGNFVNRPVLVFTIFILSEVFFGIFPPEIFMIWATQQGSFSTYVLLVSFFGLISYTAGVLGYFVGQQLSRTRLYLKITSKFGSEIEKRVRKYGGLMIFIGAVTPVPFAAVCMLTGASRYKFQHFLLIALSRIIRFAVYGYAVWQVNQI